MKKSIHKMASTALATAALLGLALTAPAMAADSDSGSQDIELAHSGQLTVCTHLPYKPFEFVNKDRDVVGFDVALADLLADDLGVKTQVISISWNQITSGAVFAARKCDLGMGGATITEKRAEAVQFSDPYFNATQVLLVKKDSGIAGLADLQGKRLGVQVATTGQLYAQEHAEEDGYTMIVYSDVALLTTAVSSGAVDAAIQDSAPLFDYSKAHPETTIGAVFDTGEHYGFMGMKDNANADRLMAAFNQALAQAKQDGTYDKLYKQWFGDMPTVAAEQ